MQTPRLDIRQIEEADLDALVELDGFAVVREAIDPFAEHIPDDPGARREYERRLVGRTDFVAAVQRASGAVLGWFQLEDDADRPGELELGYRLRPDAWGQGYATEGAAALLADALATPGVHRVYAHALLSNPGSLRVLQKIGMSYARPWEYRGLPGAEYEALRAPLAGEGEGDDA